MQKRAVELSIQTIVVAVIALIVMILIILIIRGQLGKTVSQYFGISEQAAAEANTTLKCESMFNPNRKCMTNCAPVDVPGGKGQKVYYIERTGTGTWSDCKPSEKCCERV